VNQLTSRFGKEKTIYPRNRGKEEGKQCLNEMKEARSPSLLKCRKDYVKEKKTYLEKRGHRFGRGS